MLVDYTTAGSCRYSNGSAAFKLALTNGPSTTITDEPWKNSAVTSTVTASGADRVRVGAEG